MDRHLLLCWRVMAWTALGVVVIGSLMPNPQLPDFRWSDKVFHTGAYAVLMVLFHDAYRPHRNLSVVALIGLGVALEWAQGLTGYRYADPWDATANAAGALTGWWFTLRWLQPRQILKRWIAALR